MKDFYAWQTNYSPSVGSAGHCLRHVRPACCVHCIYLHTEDVSHVHDGVASMFFSRRQHSFTDSDTSFVGSNTQRRICSLHWLDKQQVKMLWIRIQSISFQRRGKGWKRFIAGYCYFLLFFTFYLFFFFFVAICRILYLLLMFCVLV